MAIYLCRWPNGDCSLVGARDRAAAIELLDNEVGDAEGTPLFPIGSDLLINLRLQDDGRFELDGDLPLSSDLNEEILRRAYPLLNDALTRAETGNVRLTRKEVAQAVRDEKKRPVCDSRIARTPTGRHLQKLANVPAAKANRIVSAQRGKHH